MLPLVLRSVNANGLTDYFDGFTPDVEIAEDVFNLGQLGDVNEPLMAAALNEIFPGRQFINYNIERRISRFESDQEDLLYQRMISE